MVDMADYVNRAAKRCGFKREFYVERNIPTHPSSILVIPFYGDMRSTFILSSFLMKELKKFYKDKYIILCSWPGFQSLFPYVDEYWSIEDSSLKKTLASEANNFYNDSSVAADITKRLFEIFEVLSSREIRSFYDRGFTQKYWDSFGQVHRFLPEVPSASRMPMDIKTQMEHRQGVKVLVYPTTRMRSKQNGKTVWLSVPRDFWVYLIEKLIDGGYLPVVCQDEFTHKVSSDFADRCLYIVPRNAADMLAVFNYVGCVLDIHSGISRMAIAARTPFLAVTERRVFVDDKDYEIDDLCCDGVPRQYVYSFVTQLMQFGPKEWDLIVGDLILAKLKTFLPHAKSANRPSSNESYEPVSYDCVRQRKVKRMGVTFIRTSKNK